MRVFKNKWFNHWARKEGVSDAVLLDAAKEAAAGNVEADLGGCLFKKRLPLQVRANAERIVFLYAFAKSDRANITAREEAALSLAAEAFVSTDERQLQELLAAGSIWELQS